MEEAKGVVKHLLLAKFKDDITPEKIEELIKGYANLVNLIPPMKAFHWYATLFIFYFSFSSSHFQFNNPLSSEQTTLSSSSNANRACK